jgi:alcohol dehydrogenase, propanol-preferring
MRAWVVADAGPIDDHPLQLLDRPDPLPGAGQVRVRVHACGVCRTDLHLAVGDLPPKRRNVVPGHEAVGTVEQLGDGARRFALGDRIGVPWLARTCGVCRFCRSDRENLCVAPLFTGWDVDGGYAEYLVVDEAYAYALPEMYDDVEAAPLLCAGIVGYRALQRADCPPGGALGIYGFGASAHLVAQLAIAQGRRVHVMTRSEAAQELALRLGAASASGASDSSPELLQSAILFAPVGTLVAPALRALDRGGTLAIAGIYLSDIPALDYQRDLFQERTLRSVTANTRADGVAFLTAATRHRIAVEHTVYPFERANDALRDLAHDRVNGAAVIVMGQ